jgi:hypothetical protein
MNSIAVIPVAQDKPNPCSEKPSSVFESGFPHKRIIPQSLFMRNQITLLLIIFSFLQLHCERKEQQPAVFDLQPDVVEAKGYVVPPDKMAPPENYSC